MVGELLKLWGGYKQNLWKPDHSVDPLQFIEEQFPRDGISKYLIDKHGALMNDNKFAMWQSEPEDRDIQNSTVMLRQGQIINQVDGIEIIFYNLCFNLFGDINNNLHGHPMFVFKNKWIGIIYQSDEKGLAILLDQKKSTLKERLFVLDSFLCCGTILRGIAVYKGYDLTSKTKTKEHWLLMLRTFEQQMKNGDSVITTVRPLFLGK